MNARAKSFFRGFKMASRAKEQPRRRRDELQPTLMQLERREVLSTCPIGFALPVVTAAPTVRIAHVAPATTNQPETAVKSTASEVTVVTPTLENRTLTVRGTNNNDTIDLTLSSGKIKVAGKSFDNASIDRIVIVGEKGDDTITVSESIKQPTRIFGGFGNDTIRGGGGADEIYGGAGEDKLFGRAGNDELWGGSGNDTLDGGSGTNTKNSGSPNRTNSVNSIEAEVIRLVNVERTSRGLKALRTNSQLNEAAALHAGNMAFRSETIGNNSAHNHVLLGVKLPTISTRLDFVGFDSRSRWAENIAFGQKSAQEVVTAWMNSPGHRANILNADVTDIGVDFSDNSKGTRFWCQVFAKA